MTDPQEKGLSANVYRHPRHDGTLGGVTSKHDEVLILGGLGCRIEGPEKVGETKLPLVRLKLKGRYLFAVPEFEGSDKATWAFGGNFIYTTDSRLSALTDYPIPVHDRDMRKERR